MEKRLNTGPDMGPPEEGQMDRKILIVAVVAVAAIVVAGALAVTFMGNDKGGAVNYLRVAPANMKASLESGTIDAYIAWEPFVSEATVSGVGEVMMWSNEIMPNHPCCVVAVSNDFLGGTNGQELTARFLRAHVDATEWMTDALDDPDGANYTLLITLASEFTLRDEATVTEALKHLEFKYAVDDKFTSALEEFVGLYIETNQTTMEDVESRGYSSVEDFVESYVDEEMLESALAVEPSASLVNPTSPIRLGYLLGDLHQLALKVARDARVLGGTQSMFEKYGVNVADALGAPYANGGVVMDNFAIDNVDIGYLGAPPALVKHLNGGVDVRIAAQANIEGSGIVVKVGSGIESIEDLVNKTVATPGESSIQHLLLKIAVERKGLDLVLKT